MTRINNTRKRLMSLMGLALSMIGFIALLALPSAGRQYPFPSPGDLILELSSGDDEPSDYDVPRLGMTWMELFKFKRLANWQRPSDQPSEVGAVHLDYGRKRESVWIDVTVVFGQIDLSKPLPIDEPRAKSGGNYLIRVGESASLQELARFGIEPFKVKVVPVELRTLNPAEVENKFKTVEVVRVEQSRKRFRIALKNVSSRNIATGKVQCGMVRISFGPIAVGETKETILDQDAVRAGPNPSLRPPATAPPPPKLAITTIVFEDLTFEGDSFYAFYYIGRKLGVRIQTVRVLGLLQAAIEDSAQDSGRALETLRQQLSALIETPDDQVLKDLAKRYSPLMQSDHNLLLGQLKSGLRDTKDTALVRVRSYEKFGAPKGTSLQSWLRTVKSQFEDEVNKP